MFLIKYSYTLISITILLLAVIGFHFLIKSISDLESKDLATESELKIHTWFFELKPSSSVKHKEEFIYAVKNTDFQAIKRLPVNIMSAPSITLMNGGNYKVRVLRELVSDIKDAHQGTITGQIISIGDDNTAVFIDYYVDFIGAKIALKGECLFNPFTDTKSNVADIARGAGNTQVWFDVLLNSGDLMVLPIRYDPLKGYIATGLETQQADLKATAALIVLPELFYDSGKLLGPEP